MTQGQGLYSQGAALAERWRAEESVPESGLYGLIELLPG